MEVSTSGAAASTASDGAAGLKPEGDAPSTGQGDAPSAAAATTGSGGVPAAEVDPGILQDMLLFFVHLALHACRGWGAPPPPESTPVCTDSQTYPVCKVVDRLSGKTGSCGKVLLP